MRDVIIIGGGLAGLSLAIQLARQNFTVTLFEKEQYPFHRVCGEYISLESWDFLESLGLDLKSLDVSIINRLEISSASGRSIHSTLPLGGFGISRYLLDGTIAAIAKSWGVELIENARIDDVAFKNDCFQVQLNDISYQARLVACCFGKRSNLDVKWKRPFVLKPKNKLNNYLGIKYHVRCMQAADTISLHNFEGGYCGIVKIEGDKYCLCYLVQAEMLKRSGGSIEQLEELILSKNPLLKKHLSNVEKIFHSPLTISQISFDKKEEVEDHMLMIGDTAGMITPICGNGMSIALHSSKLAAEVMNDYLSGKISRLAMENGYANRWSKRFLQRMKMGRFVQRMMISPKSSNRFISLIKPFPFIIKAVIRLTHGKPY